MNGLRLLVVGVSVAFTMLSSVLGQGSIAWEKRATDANPVLLAGATFVISPNPLTGLGTLIVVDGGLNDADGLANGVLQVNNALLGTYTITETVAPAGFAIDDDPTRMVTVSAGDLNAVIGTQGRDDPGDTDESDFHNRLGSIAWEKRATDSNPVLLAGATFEISPNPLTGVGTLIVVDGGLNDADGLANGVLQVNNALLGTYTITETVAPAGFAIDDDPTRMVTVSSGDLNAVIGTQGSDDPGNTDESDFHNRLGSIAWEKRATDSNPVLLAGATFEISPNPLTGVGTLIVGDGGLNDADGLANGVLQVNNALLGTYTITEKMAPLGYVIDADPTRVVVVSAGDLNAVIGTQGSDNPGVTDESDFHNSLIPVPVGSIAWEKRDAAGALLGGAQFTITPDPTDGVGILTILDNGSGDVDSALGQILVNNALPGTYTITETMAPLGYVIDADPTRVVIVTLADLYAVIGTQGSDDPGITDESDFHNAAVKQAPVGTSHTVTTLEDTPYAFTAEDFGFTDPNDTPPNNFKAVKITTLPGAGTLSSGGSAVTNGQTVELRAGVDWTARETNRQWISIASSSDGTKLIAAEVFGQLHTSTDTGTNWMARAPTNNWTSVAAAADGTKLVAADPYGQLHTSTDAGTNWTARAPTNNWTSVASSADGTKLIAAASGGQLYTSTDAGTNWTARANSRQWTSVASSADGTKLVAAVDPGELYTSTDSGTNWTARESIGTWWSVASSADGTKLIAAASGGQLYTSTDAGTNWTARESSRNWQSVASSADGTKLVAVVNNGLIYTSTDSGTNWTAHASSRPWTSVASSADGMKLVAGTSGGQIYVSQGGLDLTFTPGPDGNGSPYSSFTFQVQDDGGTDNGGVDLDPTPKTMTLDVTGVSSDQTINFVQIPNQRLTNIVHLVATASSGLPVTFSVDSGPAVLADGTNLTFTGTGEVIVRASQDGDADWNPAATTSQTFRVGSSLLSTDYDGDGMSDLPVFGPATGNWYIRTIVGSVLAWELNWGYAGAWPMPGDFDGDGIGDLAVYSDTTGNWHIRTLAGEVLAWGMNWGFAGAVAVPGDYDGDGVCDLAVYDGTTGNWHIRTLAGEVLAWGMNWGYAGAMPVPGDYDGDGVCDLAVYDDTTGNWHIRTLAGAVLAWGMNWGFAGAVAVPGDYDGDGLCDLAVYDDTTGNWYIRTLAGEVLAWEANWGFMGAVAVPGDYDGDGISDLAVYEDVTGHWYIRTVPGKVFAWEMNWGSEVLQPVGSPPLY